MEYLIGSLTDKICLFVDITSGFPFTSEVIKAHSINIYNIIFIESFHKFIIHHDFQWS